MAKVFPVFVTGLHCGVAVRGWRCPCLVDVFPVFVTGLRCGHEAAYIAAMRAPVFPVFVTRLHCGSEVPATRPCAPGVRCRRR